MKPLVTVLLPVYNGAKYLRPAIESILNQTYINFEFLIINDGSSDNSVNIISSYNDERIRLVNNEENIGIVATLNKGIDLAKGKYIARMDADDIAQPQRLEKQVGYLTENPDVAMVDTIMEYIDDNGLSTFKYNSDVIEEAAIRKTMQQVNCMGHSSIMMQTDEYINYHYRKIYYEDDDLWLRLLNDGKRICKIGEPLLLYRIHNESIIKKDNDKNIGFTKFVKTRWFYYKNLSGSDKFKPFNLKILCWLMIYWVTLLYKKMR